MAKREYKDSEGNVVTLDKLVRIEPEWAANIIRWYEGKLDAAENAMRKVVSHLQHSQRGSTHWAGCSDVHPVCQAIDMLVNALPSRDVEKLSPKSQSHGVNDVNLEPR